MVRKQTARALRQEGAVLEAIVQLMTAEDPTRGPPVGPAAAAAAAAAANGRAMGQQGEAGGGAAAGVRGGVLYPDFMSLAEGADSWSAAANWPAARDDAFPRLPAALRRLWARAGRGSRRLGRGLSRLSGSLRGSRASLRDAAAVAAAATMGIHPDMYAAVDPIYAMTGPTAASLQVREGPACLAGGRLQDTWAGSDLAACHSAGRQPTRSAAPPHRRPPPQAAHAHMRFTHFELDVYRRTRFFPWLPFQRLLLLVRPARGGAGWDA